MDEEQAPIATPKPQTSIVPAILIVIIVVGLLTLGGIFFFRFGGFPKQTAPTVPSEIVTITPKPTPTPTSLPSPTPIIDDSKLIKQAILGKLGLNESQAVVTISQNTGKHAKGGVREIEAVGGGYFLAAKTGENWVIVYDGQANPTCEQIAPYNFPVDMVPECLDTNGKVVKR